MTEHLLPISALQHLMFCERQFALIHLDREWLENRFTAEGRVLHERVHDPSAESRRSVRTTRTLSVCSEKLGIAGQCDVVEFHPDGSVIPVEYKRGKPKAHRGDEVQLCAQALCLEEMLAVSIPKGFLFYGTLRRRTEVAFDETLRQLVEATIARARSILDSGELPSAVYEAKKCSACSLADTCQPRAKKSVRTWLAQQLESPVAT